MQHIVLPEVHCIAIEGPDARRFAQAQFSGNVKSLAAGCWHWNAWLDPQGRVRALMQLACLGDESFLAMLRGGDAEERRTELARYLLRARAALATRTYSGLAGEAVPTGQVTVDMQGSITFGCGERSLKLIPPGADADPEAANAWRLADIRAGWPSLPPGEASFLPPALGLQRLGAVSLDKGCYPGQEIVARLHYRGGHKFRLCHLRGQAWLEPGTRHAGSNDHVWILDIATAAGTVEALAVMPESFQNSINILGDKYEVVSKYDA